MGQRKEEIVYLYLNISNIGWCWRKWMAMASWLGFVPEQFCIKLPRKFKRTWETKSHYIRDSLGLEKTLCINKNVLHEFLNFTIFIQGIILKLRQKAHWKSSINKMWVKLQAKEDFEMQKRILRDKQIRHGQSLLCKKLCKRNDRP